MIETLQPQGHHFVYPVVHLTAQLPVPRGFGSMQALKRLGNKLFAGGAGGLCVFDLSTGALDSHLLSVQHTQLPMSLFDLSQAIPAPERPRAPGGGRVLGYSWAWGAVTAVEVAGPVVFVGLRPRVQAVLETETEAEADEHADGMGIASHAYTQLLSGALCDDTPAPADDDDHCLSGLGRLPLASLGPDGTESATHAPPHPRGIGLAMGLSPAADLVGRYDASTLKMERARRRKQRKAPDAPADADAAAAASSGSEAGPFAVIAADDSDSEQTPGSFAVYPSPADALPHPHPTSRPPFHTLTPETRRAAVDIPLHPQPPCPPLAYTHNSASMAVTDRYPFLPYDAHMRPPAQARYQRDPASSVTLHRSRDQVRLPRAGRIEAFDWRTGKRLYTLHAGADIPVSLSLRLPTYMARPSPSETPIESGIHKDVSVTELLQHQADVWKAYSTTALLVAAMEDEMERGRVYSWRWSLTRDPVQDIPARVAKAQDKAVRWPSPGAEPLSVEAKRMVQVAKSRVSDQYGIVRMQAVTGAKMLKSWNNAESRVPLVGLSMLARTMRDANGMGVV
jgi:hypothetical protein